MAGIPPLWLEMGVYGLCCPPPGAGDEQGEEGRRDDRFEAY